MLLEIAALIASVALLVGGVAFLLLAAGVYTRLAYRAGATGGLSKIPGLGPEPEPEMPERLEVWIQRESEPWAQEELESRAKRLYQELGDWDEVYAELTKTIVETQAPGDSLNAF